MVGFEKLVHRRRGGGNKKVRFSGEDEVWLFAREGTPLEMCSVDMETRAWEGIEVCKETRGDRGVG